MNKLELNPAKTWDEFDDGRGNPLVWLFYSGEGYVRAVVLRQNRSLSGSYYQGGRNGRLALTDYDVFVEPLPTGEDDDAASFRFVCHQTGTEFWTVTGDDQAFAPPQSRYRWQRVPNHEFTITLSQDGRIMNVARRHNISFF